MSAHTSVSACWEVRGRFTVLYVCSSNNLIASFPTPAARCFLSSSWCHPLASSPTPWSILHLANAFWKWCSFAGAVNAGGDWFLEKQQGISARSDRRGRAKLTSESPSGAPAILFSPDSIALSLATVGPSSYSPPRGIVSELWY